MAIDLQRPEGVDIIRSMVKVYDVVIQNFRPGVAKRLKLDYQSLSAINPTLIMLSISGFGSSGPYVEAKVYDPIVQAMIGAGSINPNADGTPTTIHNLICDKVTALHAAQSVTAALLARERGYGGQEIELNMLECGAHFMYPRCALEPCVERATSSISGNGP